MKSMFFTIIKSSLINSFSQKFLAFLTIFLSVSLIACMLNITLKIGNQVAKDLRSYGSNIVVLPKSQTLSIDIAGHEYAPLKNIDYLKESDLHTVKEIFWRNNITSFAPFLEGNIISNNKKFFIEGTYFNKIAGIKDEPDFATGVINLFPFWVVDGRYPKDDSLDEVLVGKKLADEENIKIGDILDLASNKVKVVGILKGADNEESRILTSLKLAQNIFNKPNLINYAKVSAMTIPENDLSLKARRNLDSLNSVQYDKWYCSAYVSSIAYQITEEYPGATAKAVLSVSEAQSGITKKIQSLMAIVSIIALIVSSIGITSLMSSEIYRRKKEIGLLKALGASSFSIYITFVAETVIVGIIASCLGAAFGYCLSFLIGFQLFGSFIGISLMVIPLSVIFGVLICIIGSLLPLKNVNSLLPAEVLYGRK